MHLTTYCSAGTGTTMSRTSALGKDRPMAESLVLARRAALVVIELQNDLVHETRSAQSGIPGALARAVRDSDLLTTLSALLSAWRRADLPVVYAVRERHPALAQPSLPIYRRAGSAALLQTGTWGADIVDAVAPHPGDLVLRRFTSLDPSYGSGLWSTLRGLGATTIVAAGVSTTLAVEGTVRAAANRGLRSVVVSDCCTSVPEQWHRFSVENVLPLLATVVTAAELTALLPGQPTP
jgi:nicotinamidase-related amidase